MYKIIITTFLLITSCGKKGDLFLEGNDMDAIIEIDEERIYKF